MNTAPERPRATYGHCERCTRYAERGYITTSVGDLLVCLWCYIAFTELPADHPGRP